MKKYVWLSLVAVALVLWLTLALAGTCLLLAGLCAWFVIFSACVGIVALLGRVACAVMSAYVWLTDDDA